MRTIENRISILIIAILTILAFGAPTQTEAKPNHIEPNQFSCANVSEIPQIECEALVALYNSTDGPNWNVTAGWLVTATPCNWYGVICQDGYVIELRLDGIGLSDMLPAEIGNLSNLTLLDLSYNRSYYLPSEIGRLHKLTTLNLSSSRLFSVHPEEIWTLPNLTHLILGDNRIRYIPPEIGNLPNLTTLDMSDNDVYSLPPEIGNLSKLTTFDLTQNELRNLPPEMSNLSSLAVLNLYSNGMGFVPPVIGNLSNLTELILARNRLSELPAELGNLSNLTKLDLSLNNFSSLPSNIWTLPSLTTLDISNNDLNHLPSEIWTISGLTSLDLGYNKFNHLPPEIGHLSNLTTLALENNQFSSLPIEIWTLLNLSRLFLWDNQFSSIPPEIGNLAKLTELELSGNQLSSLPAEIAKLSNLTHLSLALNDFETIPEEIWNFVNLTYLDLEQNELSSLPSEIGNLSRLTELFITSNRLSSLPPEIGKLKDLTELNLGDNQLSNLPEEIWTLSNLVHLYLNNNELGSLSSSIGNLNKLEWLWLDRNYLSSLPAEIANLSSLRYISFESNQLSRLPAFDNLPRFPTVHLGYNRLVVSDPNLRNLLRSSYPLWESTQTIAPTNITAVPLSSSSIQLTWRPIAFHDKDGYYEISLAAEDGTFIVQGTTTSKSDNSYTIDGLIPEQVYAARIRTYTSPHSGRQTLPYETWDDQRNELWSEYSEFAWFKLAAPTSTPTPTATSTPTPTATPTVTNTPTATPVLDDDYEPDDDCANAVTIQPDGVWQAHNFHKAGDIDWTTFTAPAAGMYRIEVAIPDGSQADVDLFYYTACTNSAAAQFTETFTPRVRLDVQADSPGQQFYIELRNADERKFGLDVNYNLSVREIASLGSLSGTSQELGPAIVVAGRYREDDSAQDNINQVALNAYNLFKMAGRSDSEIYFLATDSTLVGYDRMATQTNLEAAITDWAKELLQEEERSKTLNLYLVDHGNQDQLYLDGVNEEILVPGDLDAWLTTLEDEIAGLQVNVILEANRAGSFIDSNNGTVSKSGRTIITSSSQRRDADLSPSSAVFSDSLISLLAQGHDLGYSFSESTKIVQMSHSSQEPWIDADGNSQPNEPGDFKIASARSLVTPDSSASGWPPYIVKTELVGHASGIQVEVRHQGGISEVQEVWAVVYPPEYTPPTGASLSDGELNEEALDVIAFEVNDEALFVEAESYLGFTETGVYQVVIHARDRNGLVAQPMMMRVDTHHWLYLPVVSR